MKLSYSTTLLAVLLSVPPSAQATLVQTASNVVPLTTPSTNRRVWVRYPSGQHDVTLQSLQTVHTFSTSSSSDPPVQVHYDFDALDALVITATDAELERLGDNVEIMEDPPRQLLHLPESVRRVQRSLQQQVIPEGVEMVEAPAVWQQGATGAGVKVCVMDTGIDVNHEDFDDDQLDGLAAGYGWDRDVVGHGTHVSGTIAAQDNGIGVVGVAPDAEIYTLKVFTDQGFVVYASSLVEAAYECQASGAQVISMSLGGPLYNQFEAQVFDELFDEGIISVAAAGNDGTSVYNYPATYDGVISVGAVDFDKDVAYFSQRNNRVEVVAPGQDILSTLPMDPRCEICREYGVTTYGTTSGTSMSTPHVAGIAALPFSAYSDATSADIRNALSVSAEDLGSTGRDNYYGYGLVSAKRAFDLVGNGPVDEPDDLLPEPDTGSLPDQGVTSCADDEMLVEIVIQTDFYAFETSYSLERESDGLAITTGSGLQDNSLYTGSYCLFKDCYTFSVFDSANDGLCCSYGNGGFAVQVDGKLTGSGAQFGSKETVSFGECSEEPAQPAPPVDQGCVDVELLLRTDRFPEETFVTLEDEVTGETIWSFGQYDLAASQDYYVDACVDPLGCYRFEMLDSQGDGICCGIYGNGGYQLLYDGDKVAVGGNFDSQVIHRMGDGC